MQNIITFFTQSSEDPAKTSATLTGLLISFASYAHTSLSFIPAVNTFFASNLGQQVDPILTAVGMIVGGIWFIFGLIRKLTNGVEKTAGLRVE